MSRSRVSCHVSRVSAIGGIGGIGAAGSCLDGLGPAARSATAGVGGGDADADAEPADGASRTSNALPNNTVSRAGLEVTGAGAMGDPPGGGSDT